MLRTMDATPNRFPDSVLPLSARRRLALDAEVDVRTLERALAGLKAGVFRRPESDEDAGGGQHNAWRSNLQPLERSEIELTEAIRNRWHWRCCDSNAFREECSNGSQCWSRRS